MADVKIADLNWEILTHSIQEQGYAVTPPLLDATTCQNLIRLYEDDSLFRSTVHMARYRFGVGEYKYLAAPLPALIAKLRSEFYPPLAEVANDWAIKLRQEERFPLQHESFLEQCHANGQTKPTPLLLRYEAGGYNCLHQDLYGELAFPFQVVFVLSEPRKDFTGGELLLVEQRPRAQSRGHVVTLEQGQALIFPTRYRPMKGTRGYYRVTLRHGVSTVQMGRRYSLGIIFHDAK